MSKAIRDSPATIGFLAIVWSLYVVRLIVESRFGQEAVTAVFVIQYTDLASVWTWITAPFGHANFAHLVVNSVVALYVVPEAERTFGFKLTSAGLLLGGAMTAVIGTVLVVVVRSPFLADAATASGMGSSMGLFVLVGMILERYRSYPVPFRGVRRLGMRNSTFFVLLLLASVFGVGFDIWRKLTGFDFPGLGHHYHSIGLLVGWAVGLLVRDGRAI